MIKKIINITKNHYDAAIEHLQKFQFDVKPSMFGAFLMTIEDLIFRHTIYLPEYRSHLVYELWKVQALNMRSAFVTRIYVPKQHRNKGVASIMLDMIKEDNVLSDHGKYGEVSKIYVARINNEIQ